VRAGNLVLKVDMLVEHTDMPAGMTYRQAARKAVAMCLSDFAAKGARPDSFVVSIGLKRGVSQEQVEELALGFRDAEVWGVHLVGGDTNEAKELVIDCAMVGFAKRIVTRSGARPGDILVVTGPFGYTSAGLRILEGSARAGAEFGDRARASVLDPRPSVRVGIALAPFLTSAMDSSDGLARSLHTLAAESGVGFDVTDLPEARGVRSFAKANGLSAEELVLQGGEEYVVVGTVPRRKFAHAAAAVRSAGGTLREIGKATAVAGHITLSTDGKRKPVMDAGWTHLR